MVNVVEHVPGSHRYVGSPRFCLFMDCCSVGKVKMPDGSERYITWGRNLTEAELQKSDLSTDAVCTVGDCHELIIPDTHVAVLLPTLVDRRL